jgi:sigma-B regulation protein RsbU (phosphoserine phosphatase)
MLHRDTRLGEFVTLFYGVLDVKARRLTYCCAGHPPALLWRGGQVKQLTTDDILLGIEPDARFHQATLDLHDGDRLMIYTDGLPDAQNFAGERFGDARILETFAQGARHPSAADAAAHLRRTLRNYVGLADRSDDVTTVHLHVGPQE